MELKLIRDIKSTKSTIGTLYIDNVKETNILEDVDRGLKQSDPLSYIITHKQYGKTAIPTGRYQVIISQSVRFKRFLPEIINVPGYLGIRIHPGNDAADTDGCLLPGTYSPKASDFVSNSKIAFDKLFPKLQAALKTGNVFINIV